MKTSNITFGDFFPKGDIETPCPMTSFAKLSLITLLCLYISPNANGQHPQLLNFADSLAFINSHLSSKVMHKPSSAVWMRNTQQLFIDDSCNCASYALDYTHYTDNLHRFRYTHMTLNLADLDTLETSVGERVIYFERRSFGFFMGLSRLVKTGERLCKKNNSAYLEMTCEIIN